MDTDTNLTTDSVDISNGDDEEEPREASLEETREDLIYLERIT